MTTPLLRTLVLVTLIGTTSVMTMPVAANKPLLEKLNLYVMVSPGAARSGVTVLSITRSGATQIVLGGKSASP